MKLLAALIVGALSALACLMGVVVVLERTFCNLQCRESAFVLFNAAPVVFVVAALAVLTDKPRMDC